MKADKFPGERSIAVLLDPDKAKGDRLKKILSDGRREQNRLYTGWRKPYF